MKLLQAELYINKEDVKEIEYLLSIEDLDGELDEYYSPKKNDERQIDLITFEDGSSLCFNLYSGSTNYWLECGFIRSEDLLCLDGMNNPISHDTILGTWMYEYNDKKYIVNVKEK